MTRLLMSAAFAATVIVIFVAGFLTGHMVDPATVVHVHNVEHTRTVIVKHKVIKYRYIPATPKPKSSHSTNHSASGKHAASSNVAGNEQQNPSGNSSDCVNNPAVPGQQVCGANTSTGNPVGGTVKGPGTVPQGTVNSCNGVPGGPCKGGGTGDG